MGAAKPNRIHAILFSPPPPTEYRKIRGFSVDFGNRGYLERQIDVRAKVDARDASASCQGSPSYEEEFCASHDGTKAFPRLAFIELRVSAEIMPHPNADRGGRYGASAWIHGYSWRNVRGGGSAPRLLNKRSHTSHSRKGIRARRKEPSGIPGTRVWQRKLVRLIISSFFGIFLQLPKSYVSNVT